MRVWKVVNFSNNYLTDYGASLLMDMALNNGWTREIYLFGCCLLGPRGQSAISRAQDALREQCAGDPPHSMILWSMFDEPSQPVLWPGVTGLQLVMLPRSVVY